MKYPFTIFFILTFALTVFGQTEEKPQIEQSNVTVGFEIDVVPYITGGYYASAWLGFRKSRQRIRPVFALVNVPDFLTADGINKKTIQVYGIMTDYFFKSGFEKFWISTGIEYWDGEMENELTQKAPFNKWIFTFGAGYVWKFYKNFYLTPWIAGNFRIAGDETVQIGDTTIKLAIVAPEVSLKLGWHF